MKSSVWTSFAVSVFAILVMSSASLTAQQGDRLPSRFGLLLGLNYNMVSLDTNGIGAPNGFAPDADIATSVESGSGIGPYVGLLYEYAPGTFGFHIRGTYDSRSATFSDSTDVDATLNYLTIEPALRVELGSPNFHALIGPSLNLLIDNSLSYTSLVLPAQGVTDVDTAKNALIGLWGGLGYDIELSRNRENGTGWFLTPFIEGSWLPSQVDNEFQDWSTVTVRGGIQLKYAWGGPTAAAPPVEAPAATGGIDLNVRTPLGGVSEQRRLEEFLPLLNYLFYGDGETKIPARYETLTPNEAQSFSEKTMLDRKMPTTGAASTATRSQRQLEVYYNSLNIIGSRLRENPDAKISLVGASPSTENARKMAESVKDYLVNSFGIDPSRIDTKGQARPPHASGTRNTPKEDEDLIEEENRRVEILTNDPKLLEPVKLNARQEEPLENDLVFELNLTSATSVKVWNLNVQGTDNDFSQTYGPFYGKVARVNATTMLGDRDQGSYRADVQASTYDDEPLVTSEQFELQKKRSPLATGTRYSILFEYDDSKSVNTYEDFLRKEVAPRIPNGATVFIHGHTDITGKDDYNAELSARRAVDAQKVLEDELKKLGRDITFDAYGFGETQFRAPFANTSPEERYYNRTVMVEIIPES